MTIPAATILVIEDNPMTRKMVRVALSAEGYGVIEAADARGALAAAERNHPDLVLQDFGLPDMDGRELLGRLRALPGGAELPILALTGFLSHLDDGPPDSGGFTALLVKPIEPSRLVAAVRRHLPVRATPATRPGEGRRLLIVDDNPVLLKLARITFSHLGFDVRCASSAANALAAALINPPDVVLCDVFMPETDGFQACHALRQEPRLADVPVVLLSGHYGSTADRDLATRMGASALVLRTPDFGLATAAIVKALQTNCPVPAESPSQELALSHARLVIHQLEQKAATLAGLAQRCGVQAAQLSLLSGVADALTRNADIDVALREALVAVLDLAGVPKAALLLRDGAGALRLRQDVGFSGTERSALRECFGHAAWFDEIVTRGLPVSFPSDGIPDHVVGDILTGAKVASAHAVPLISTGDGIGLLLIGATITDVTSDDSVAFAQALGNQIIRALELARSVALLTASEQRYRTLLGSAGDYIAVMTPDGVVREMNHRWVALTGLPHDQLVGRHIGSFGPEGSEAACAQVYSAAVTPTGARAAVVPIARSGAPDLLMEFSSATAEVGGERLVLAIGRDITER